MRLLTLTTDFGLNDAYVAAMKGVALSINPDLRLVDVTHGVGAQDVMEAAFVLREAVPYFPPETVHLVVVDPGVGTERRALALRIGDQFFVGPDNGLFSLLPGGTEPDEAVVLDNPAAWRSPEPSATFHGRDIFAPAAAHLASGRALPNLGSPAGAIKRLHWVQPLADEQGIRGWVVHIDRFGNAITNVPADLLDAHRTGRSVKCYVGSTTLDALHTTYGDVETGEPVALVGSSGMLEVGVNGGDAAQLLSIHKGSVVHVVFADAD